MPPGPTRSGSSKHSARGTSGSGRRAARSYNSTRCWRPICSRSRNPAVVTKAVRAPLRSNNALVATVEPWTICLLAIGTRCNPSSTARAGSSGVENTLKVVRRPVASSKMTKSVNVPPMSIPMRTLIAHDDAIDTGSDLATAVAQPSGSQPASAAAIPRTRVLPRPPATRLANYVGPTAQLLRPQDPPTR